MRMGRLNSREHEVVIYEVDNLIADAAILELPKVSLQAKDLLPEYSGIYYVLDEVNTIWYIGQAKNIRKRWNGKTHHRIYQLESQRKNHFTIYYEQVSELQLNSIEKQRIEMYSPHLNDSPVKTKNVRPTEVLLRETLVAIAPFSFILGVEPPRQELGTQANHSYQRNIPEKNLNLCVIHICLDSIALNSIHQTQSIEEAIAIEKKPFNGRKVYANKWKDFNTVQRLLVNGYVIEVTSWNLWYPDQESEELRIYIQSTLAQESIKALTPESLSKIQGLADTEKYYGFCLQRLNPYTSDIIHPLFNDLEIDREKIKRELEELSEDYKTGRRGVGSRPTPANIDELLISRGIDINHCGRREEIQYSARNRMEIYVQCFSVDLKMPHFTNIAKGILNNEEVRNLTVQFDNVYLLARVEEKAWLLVENYLKDFAKPAGVLKHGEGCVEKFYVSARKYLEPAIVNIRLEEIGYSASIPFGLTEEFSTFESATEEIRRRLINSGLPGLKMTFKRETTKK